MCAKNMWGNLNDIEKIKTPLGILREQASLLSESTKGILIGVVTIGGSPYSSEERIATLCIVCLCLMIILMRY